MVIVESEQTSPPAKEPPSSHSLSPQISEALLARLWREKAARHSLFVTSRGQKIKILYPGRQNASSGPDFKDALFYQDGLGLVRGDVELHLSGRDWQAHGHHLDSNYNGVTLHAVAGTADNDAFLSNGMEAPTISLSPLLTEDVPPHASGQDVIYKLLSLSGYRKPSSRGQAIELLEQAGVARFLGKSKSYKYQMAYEASQEVLYQALMEAAGYSQNQRGFLKLSQAVPFSLLSRLMQISSSISACAAVVEQRLLEAAGFEGTQANTQFRGDALPPVSWRFFRVRPSNHPRRRIRGMAHIFVRYGQASLLQGLRRLVLQASDGLLEKGLKVEDPDGGPALIGASRASDMAVNVILPFFHAWGLETGDEDLQNASLRCYRSWPSLQGNGVISSTEEALFPVRWLPLARGACQQQGVIHLQRLLKGEKAETVDLGCV
jgi:hypothetical protein